MNMENAVLYVVLETILSVFGVPKVLFTEVMGPRGKGQSQRDAVSQVARVWDL
jgi:hypothetical protein